MRVVYDTNVAAALLLRRGEIIKLKQLVKSGKVTVITSEFILDELIEVLHTRLGMTRQRAKASVRVFARIAQVIKPAAVVAVTRDPDDDHIIATAVGAAADYIVSLDNDLLVLRAHKGIEIINPGRLVNLL
ncbi:MAG TPA: putative toxin-antitoxin system toxin component, PIN family, partial [Candidatus Saccharimonadales bacterium]